MSDFLFEGGYAFYVWTAYGLSALGIGLMVVLTLRAYGKAKRAVQASETNL